MLSERNVLDGTCAKNMVFFVSVCIFVKGASHPLKRHLEYKINKNMFKAVVDKMMFRTSRN